MWEELLDPPKLIQMHMQPYLPNNKDRRLDEWQVCRLITILIISELRITTRVSNTNDMLNYGCRFHDTERYLNSACLVLY
jgi:hypothetical protein